jgi:putative membrane protein
MQRLMYLARPSGLAPAFAFAVLGACWWSRPAPPVAESSALTDAQIAAVVIAANNADIAFADLALAKSQDAQVREFAVMVKKDHESVNEAAAELLGKLGVTPEGNVRSFDLRDDTDTKRLMLRDLEGFAFDSAYADNELRYHRAVLTMVDDLLIPSATNAEFKALLVAVRPAVAAHLELSTTLAAQKTKR